MPDLSALIAFIMASVIIESTPGPNMGYLAILSIHKGKKDGLFAVAGVALGLLIVGILAAFGVAAMISESPLMYQILRWGGVLYMLWLAWDGWHDEATETSAGTAHSKHDGFKYFRRGLITNLLNPKAAVFYVAMLPTFVNTQHAVLTQTLSLTIVFVIIATGIHAMIVLLASKARIFLSSPERMRITRRILSVLLAFIAFWFAYETAQG